MRQTPTSAILAFPFRHRISLFSAILLTSLTDIGTRRAKYRSGCKCADDFRVMNRYGSSDWIDSESFRRRSAWDRVAGSLRGLNLWVHLPRAYALG